MADDIHEEQAAMRRSIRRIEDEVADLERNKANHDDMRPIVAKQSEADIFVRTRLTAIQSENEDVRHILKRMAESLTSIDDRLTKLKRDTDTEIQAVKSLPELPKSGRGDDADLPEKRGRSIMPFRLQLVLCLLAGVGLLALLQGAPQALLTMFPNLRSGF